MVDALVIAHSEAIGIARCAIGDQEIIARLVHALVNKGVALLGEGYATREAFRGGAGPAWHRF